MFNSRPRKIKRWKPSDGKLSYKSEGDFQKALILAIQDYVPNVKIFRRNVGVFLTIDGQRTVRIEKTGAADVYGFCKVKNFAVHFEIETKMPKKGMTQAQKDFKKSVEEIGAIHILSRDIGETIKELKEKLSGLG